MATCLRSMLLSSSFRLSVDSSVTDYTKRQERRRGKRGGG
jgi:hypothetical protein